MNNEKPYRDQAERLRKRITKKEELEHIELSKELPPRSRVHYQKAKRTRVKLKYPLIRLLAIFFILLPIVSFSIYSINESKAKRTASVEQNLSGNIESVDVRNDDPVERVFEDEEEPTEIVIEEDEEEEKEELEAEVAPELEKVEPVKEEITPPSSTVPDKDSNNDKATVQEEIIYHKVQKEETLYRIAMKYYKSQAGIDIIRQANGIQGNEIQLGQTLKIPIQK
ncbi:LysM peptidoglycan-binding domain-containing protein [Robertmurraya massiliosenegalensis]|uniref:LysM peptidoglycan-binding domain-containing protein n=1 Tax=Robertmurraya TaxID=2837507 RepID=UPI0039A67A8F